MLVGVYNTFLEIWEEVLNAEIERHDRATAKALLAKGVPPEIVSVVLNIHLADVTVMLWKIEGRDLWR